MYLQHTKVEYVLDLSERRKNETLKCWNFVDICTILQYEMGHDVTGCEATIDNTNVHNDWSLSMEILKITSGLAVVQNFLDMFYAMGETSEF